MCKSVISILFVKNINMRFNLHCTYFYPPTFSRNVKYILYMYIENNAVKTRNTVAYIIHTYVVDYSKSCHHAMSKTKISWGEFHILPHSLSRPVLHCPFLLHICLNVMKNRNENDSFSSCKHTCM